MRVFDVHEPNHPRLVRAFFAAIVVDSSNFTVKTTLKVSYPNFVRGLLLDNMQPLIGRFEIPDNLCCTICEVQRRIGNLKETGLRDP